MSRIDAFLERFTALHPKLMDLSLERIERLLADLGHPEDRLPPVIHVAGTNGKGSVVAYLRAMLEAAGKSVHVYTSPHLVRFNERIRLAGELVPDEKLIEAFERAETVNAGQGITFFEITTAAAYILFSETPADYLLLETGLGGRVDTTNVVDHPLGTIITSISLDHMQFLGETLADIAGEKAGIFKPGSPAVIARQPEEAFKVLEARCLDLGIAPFVAGHDFDGYEQAGRFVYQDLDGLEDLPRPRLLGTHQIDNAALAVAAIRHFNLPVDGTAMAAGLRQVDWPARMMPLEGELKSLIGAEDELWLDGGHNQAGAEALARALSDLNEKRSLPLTLVLGMLSTKDAARYVAAFTGLAKQIVTVTIPDEPNAIPAEDLAEVARKGGFEARAANSISEALGSLEPGAKRVVIGGSLYLAGAVLKQNGTLPR
ncbi:bifunctional folylpolyglutamate synthase/dihydrofolate synthase [Cucumibacter marinus]|uniref:bifunctional folylpolyglutamate synthase/dihydrofolate synthase n=1 Tax=Cucumibacter marinus TaxID=1121252 RepID=UPI00041D0695|nr:folylpolyglutamate synthase/dihydrofolate synthase family protein [Cucumibacter marinus]